MLLTYRVKSFASFVIIFSRSYFLEGLVIKSPLVALRTKRGDCGGAVAIFVHAD